MLLNNRVIFKDNTTLTDLSVAMSDIHSQDSTLAVVAAEDALFIGSDLPFNHRYFHVQTANDQTSSVSVYLWSGTEWKAAAEVVDLTKSSGKTLAQSGIIAWVPDRDLTSWSYEDKTSDMADLSSFKIYDLYWVKIVFSGNLKATTAIRYIGHKFSNDTDLTAEYPELGNSSLKTAFQAGKTDWNVQNVLAAEYIIQDLREMGVVCSKNQVLDWQNFKAASVHKTAEIIFRAFGDDYKDNLERARKAYKSSLTIKTYNVDKNANATLDAQEKTTMTGFFTR